MSAGGSRSCWRGRFKPPARRWAGDGSTSLHPTLTAIKQRVGHPFSD